MLVRYFTRDDEAQWLRARTLIRALTPEEPGYIPLVTLAELVWVMESRYRLRKPQLLEMISMLLRMPGFVLEDAGQVIQALQLYGRSDAGFADCLIVKSAASAGCSYTVTFDRRAESAGMRLVP